MVKKESWKHHKIRIPKNKIKTHLMQELNVKYPWTMVIHFPLEYIWWSSILFYNSSVRRFLKLLRTCLLFLKPLLHVLHSGTINNKPWPSSLWYPSNTEKNGTIFPTCHLFLSLDTPSSLKRINLQISLVVWTHSTLALGLFPSHCFNLFISKLSKFKKVFKCMNVWKQDYL